MQLALAALATASLAPGYALILGQALGAGAEVPALLLTQAGLLLACAALAARPGTWRARAAGAQARHDR